MTLADLFQEENMDGHRHYYAPGLWDTTCRRLRGLLRWGLFSPEEITDAVWEVREAAEAKANERRARSWEVKQRVLAEDYVPQTPQTFSIYPEPG